MVLTAKDDELLQRVTAMRPEQREALLRLATPRMVEKYMTHIPHPKQQVFMMLRNKEAMYGGAAGGGKAGRIPDRCSTSYDSSMETKVLTPNGFVLLGEVKVGDRVCNPDGTVATVKRTIRMKQREFYRVTFADGASVEAAADHLWPVRDRRNRKRRKVALGEIPSGLTRAEEWNHRYFQRYTVMTTEEVRERLLDGASLSVPLTSPVQFTRPKGRWSTLPPYTVGVLLGDGSLSKGMAQWMKPDPEIAQRVNEEVKQLGLGVTERTKDGSYSIVVMAAGSASGAEHLRRIGLDGTVSETKFVPETYKYRTDEERFSLVQGLMDTDGYVDDRGHVEYCTVSERLALDVQWLLRSLGYTATISKKEAPTYKYKGEKRTGQPAYRVYVRGNDMDRLFWLKRKNGKSVLRVGVGSGDTSGDMWVDNPIVSVEPTGSDPAKCITVDNPNGLYITDDFVVTHNSDALLMAASQYVDVPGYSALILRRTWPDLNMAGAILDRARTWWKPTDAAEKEGGRTWYFPTKDADGNESTPARITFGYIQHDKDKYKFQSAEFQFVGFDELTQFEKGIYTYLFSRIRRPAVECLSCHLPLKFDDKNERWAHATPSGRKRCKGIIPDPLVLRQYPSAPDGTSVFTVPIRMRSATNPGGVGHEWVRSRFIDPRTRIKTATFVPALLSDNPSLDQESYRDNLEYLDPVDRERLLAGDWDVVEEGEMFHRHWFNVINEPPAEGQTVRYWDNAATAGGGDYTVGTKLKLYDGRWYVLDVVRGQWSTAQKENVMMATAAADGRNVRIRMEQEPGSAGVDVIDHMRRRVFVGYNFNGIRSTGSKVDRAAPFASSAEAGNVFLIPAPWNKAFLDEFALFPFGAHDDIVDSTTGGMSFLSSSRSKILV